MNNKNIFFMFFSVYKKTAREIGGQGVDKSYIRMTLQFFGFPYFITAAPRPLSRDFQCRM
jgi:hypothetical protein